MKKRLRKRLRGVVALMLSLAMFMGGHCIVSAAQPQIDFDFTMKYSIDFTAAAQSLEAQFNNTFAGATFDSNCQLGLKGYWVSGCTFIVYADKKSDSNEVLRYKCSTHVDSGNPKIYVNGYRQGDNSNAVSYTANNPIDLLEYYNTKTGKTATSVKVSDIYINSVSDLQAYIVITDANPAEVSSSSSDNPTKKEDKKEAPAHTHSYSWNVVTEATESGDGLELYQCSCGDVQAKSVIPASQAYVSKFRDLVKNAPANGTVTYDSKMNHTFSDYIIKRLAERNDVTTEIDFKWQNKDYTLTIPAGIDYTAILADDIEFYGYLYFAQLTGATVVAK